MATTPQSIRTPRLSIASVVRSLGVGGIGSGVDLLALFLLATVLGLGPRTASPFALLAGLAVQFFGQKWFAFRDKRPAWGKQALQFGFVEAASFGLNMLLFERAVATLPWPYLLSRVAVQCVVYASFCLPLWARIFAVRNEEVQP